MVVDIIHHFQRADDRDKLYDIMSLVDWATHPGHIPDYGKYIFRVAIEVLSMAFAGDRPKHGKKDYQSSTSHSHKRLFKTHTKSDGTQTQI
jgi:hypothetical protein